MELWIRSQDKSHLIKAEEINIEIDEDGFVGIWTYGTNKYLKYYLGSYKSEKRALEVLDEIQKELYMKRIQIPASSLGDTNHSYLDVQQNYVYKMPQE